MVALKIRTTIEGTIGEITIKTKTTIQERETSKN